MGEREAAARPLVRIAGVSKRFGALAANDRVSLDIPAGRVLGLVGENGAGKTTAMNVLAGIYLPASGRIEVDGRRLRLGAPRASVAAGIGMVHQQFKLVETLTGFENVSLALDGGRFLQPSRPGARLRALTGELGFALDLAAPVWRMTLAERQQLEILRTLAVGARVLVLDEPSSVLSAAETAGLFAILRRVAASGRAVVLISHKLLEVLEVADDVAVMRGGRVVHRGPAAATDAAALARLAVGDREIRAPARPQRAPGPAALRVRGLEVPDALGLPAVRGIDLDVAAGELVAVLGVAGNGQAELMDAVGGLRRPSAGRIDLPRRPGGAPDMAYVPARHLGEGLAPGLSLLDNAVLGRHRDPPFGAWLRRRDLRARARRVAGAFGVECAPGAPVRRLSGGNLQRLVLGRELQGAPALIAASYPTRGLDVASAAQIRAALAARAAAGAAVLMSSEEIEETLAVATRAVVMHRGAVVGECAAADADLGALARLMTTGRG